MSDLFTISHKEKHESRSNCKRCRYNNNNNNTNNNATLFSELST